MKKEPKKYKELIARYEEVYYAYNEGKHLRAEPIEVFNEWKKWVTEHNRLPNTNSRKSDESSLCFRVKKAVIAMQKEESKYVKELKEYEEMSNNPALNILNYNFEQVFAEWKAWCELHKRLPK